MNKQDVEAARDMAQEFADGLDGPCLGDFQSFALDCFAYARSNPLPPEITQSDEIEKLKAENERLKSELAFVQAYLNPKDTSFRQMIDSFKLLPKDKQDKLIDLSRALAAINSEALEGKL